MRYQTFDAFYPRADRLRQVFDERFRDPGRAHADRFRWDFWNMPGEYTALRTPAYTYFPRAVYEPFHRHLVQWGRETLGCHEISPPWLSCYIENCRQAPHRDVPHGPLAFVFSLTNWRQRRFEGGETFIQKPRVRIEPRFNRLTIFDPALVHGVRRVRGTVDPREGRLVIHGWFVNPRPFWVGPLRAGDVRRALERELPAALPARLPGPGLLSLRLRIGAGGAVLGVKELVSTLASERYKRDFLDAIGRLRFPGRGAGTRLTVPMMFG